MSYSLAFTQAIAIMISIGAGSTIKNIEWMSAADLSKALSIPRPTVVSILGKLSAAGLLETKEGNKGGVRLAAAPGKITLLHIFDAIEQKKPLFRLDAAETAAGTEAAEARLKVAMSFHRAEFKMKEELEQVTLASLFGCSADPAPEV